MRPMTESRVTVAFSDLSQGKWTAGGQYLWNLFLALRRTGACSQLELVLLQAPGAGSGSSRLHSLVDRVIDAPAAPKAPGAWRRRARGVLRRLRIDPQEEHQLGTHLRHQGVDVLFSNMQFGDRFPIPLLSWIPDFQHVHLPHLFSEQERQVRDHEFRKIADHATRVVVSSHDALGDLTQFCPSVEQKARVLRFVAQFSSEAFELDPKSICDQYHLPERFIYLPNQFWKHKNHSVVLRALCTLKASHSDCVVVCTGNTNDYRDPLFFGELLADVHRLGLRKSFLVLGILPHDHLLPLIRQSLAVLQPSRFEGWSTTVEEVKTVGKPIILSDLPVHREQNPPDALYFAPDDAELLAQHLKTVFDTGCPGQDRVLEQRAEESLARRVEELSAGFLKLSAEAAGSL